MPDDRDELLRDARVRLESRAEEIEELEARLERTRYELEAVLAAINLYGDETLHGALDDVGVLMKGRE